MIIKKFTSKTESDAVEAARKELGEGVVIMNVKSVKRKGFLGLFGGNVVEVTAALEEENLQPAAKNNTVRTQTAEQPVFNMTAGLLSHGDSTENIEKKLDSLQTLLENQMRKAEAEKKTVKMSDEEEEAAVLAMEREKQLERERELERNRENAEQERFIRLLYNTMLDNEVDEKYANLILEDIEKVKKPNTPFDYILTNTYQKMVLKFGKATGILPAEKGPRVVAFIGPTGVGKTTTIAKIASSYTLGDKKKVALLTTDTYRIAATEQLRTYANILEVPFRVIYSEEEFAGAIANYQDYDYIFVDTTGHSHQNEEQVQKVKQMIEAIEEKAEYQCFLVLSAATKYHDLLRITEKYQVFTNYELIFTKLDETTAYGNLLNVKIFTDAPIAYVTCGQNVPDDIELFNPQKTVKQLLGGK